MTAREDGYEKPLLTRRQLEALALYADGCTSGEVAARMVVTEETVKSHMRHILFNLNAVHRAHAVAVAFRLGLIE